MWRLLLVLKLIHREYFASLRNSRFLILLGLSTLLAPLVVVAGSDDFQAQVQEYLDLRHASDELDASSPLLGRQIEPSLRVLREPNPTSIIVKGLDASVPRSWDFSPAGTTANPRTTAALSPAETLPLDLELIVRVVLGLLAVSVGADSIAGKDGAGVLRALLVQPLDWSTIFFTKLVGGLLVLLTALLCIMTAAAMALAIVTHTLWLQLLLGLMPGLVVAALPYLMALFSAGMLIASLSDSWNATNILVTSLWLLIAVVGVPAVGFVAGVVARVPSRELTYSHREELYQASLRQTENSLGQLLRQLEPDPASWRQQQLPDDTRHKLEERWAAESAEIRRQVRAIDAQYDAALQRRRRTVETVSLLNPASQFLDAASRLAGSGIPSSERLDNAVASYQGALDARLFFDPPRLTVLVPTDKGVSIVSYARKVPPTAADIPMFTPPSSHRLGTARDLSTPLAVLVGYAAALTLAAGLGFNRRSSAVLMDLHQPDQS